MNTLNRHILLDDEVYKIGDRRVRFGTVSGFARKYRENETAAIDRAQERGHRLVWLNLECTIIAADPSTVDRSFRAVLHVGDEVVVGSEHAEERGIYTITAERNGNFGLVRTDDDV